MIIVLRIGHRPGRDERISTHCGLVARALGADSIIYSGEQDLGIFESIRKTTENWGGNFQARYEKNWKKVIEEHRARGFINVHLTMYGMPLQDKIKTIRKTNNVLIIIGSEKVPGELYGLADYNIAVASQPHSEVAALAIFLHEYFRGKELSREFKNAKIKIIPQEKGKKTEKL
jgi:tRNA (cytidine56-2'-O)-methyltransferase